MVTVIIYFSNKYFIICIGRVLWDISDIVTKSYGFYIIKKVLVFIPPSPNSFPLPHLDIFHLVPAIFGLPPSLVYLLCLSQCPKGWTSRKFSLPSSFWLGLVGRHQEDLKSGKRLSWVYISPISSAQVWLCRMLICFMNTASPMSPALNQTLVIS